MLVTTPLDINTAFFNAKLCVSEIIHLSSMVVNENVSSKIEDVIESNGEEIWDALGVSVNDDYEISNLAHDIKTKFHKNGFLICVETPLPLSFNGSASNYSYSLGLMQSQWLYGETIDECYAMALTWKEATLQKQYQRWLAEK